MKQLYRNFAAVMFTGCFACTHGDASLHLADVSTVLMNATILKQVKHRPLTAAQTIATPVAARSLYRTTGMLPAEKLAVLILFQ